MNTNIINKKLNTNIIKESKKIYNYNNGFLDLTSFIYFIKENSMIKIAISIVVSKYVYALTYSLLDNLILPIFNIDINNNKKKDINLIKDLEFNFFNSKIKIGEAFYSIIQFVVIIYVIFIVNQLFNKSDN